MSIEAAVRFLTLAVNDPVMANEYYKLDWEEATDQDPEDDDAQSVDACSDPAEPSTGNVVDNFPELSSNEKAILKTKNLQLILEYIKEVLPPRPIPDDEPSGGG